MPVPVEKLPAPHWSHALTPVPVWYLPAGHAGHAASPWTAP